MKYPAFLGKVVYFFGYPIFRLLIKNTNRTYVAVIFDDQLLLTKNWLGFQNKWRLPGGGVRSDESATQAAIRELLEEVGLSCTKDQLTSLTPQPVRSSFNYNYELFAMRVASSPKIYIKNQEILASQMFSKAQVLRLPIGEETARAIQSLGW